MVETKSQLQDVVLQVILLPDPEGHPDKQVHDVAPAVDDVPDGQAMHSKLLPVPDE